MPTRKPERMSFSNLNNGETFEAQFNPEELTEEVLVKWNELEVLGHSHELQQYKGTSSHTFSFKLQFSVYDDKGNRIDDIASARRYLLSLAYPPRGAQGIVGGSAPRFLFLWPNFISLTCVLHRLRFRHFKFARTGEPMYFDVDVTIKEIRDVRLFMEDVLSDGTVRDASALESSNAAS